MISRGVYLFLRTVGRSLRGNLFECDWEEEVIDLAHTEESILPLT